MANKTMHHVVIGSDTYEIVDQYAREAIESLDPGSGGSGIIVDKTLSPTSTHPVQNKTIYEAIGNVEALLASI